MAYYKYSDDLSRQFGSEFDAIHEPGALVPYSGVYRCTGCSNSSTNVKAHRFPPENAHEHHPWQGAIRWKLVVKSHWA